ncbi:MAG: ABC transporter substrate-binding protein [Deltaproteobacteria bacterium]|nr:ABC transporter substrate-binding protein [Deltaproteobacteria bacterium]
MRNILGLLTVQLALVMTVSTAGSQQAKKIPRVGLLWLEPVPRSGVEEFRKGLHDLGYVEGSNVILEHREAGGRPGRLPDLAAELVRLRVDVIVSYGGAPIGVLKNTTKTIPIVMPIMSDPIAGGFVANPLRPEGNITGITNFAPELSGKRLELLKEAIPTTTRVAVLWSSVPALEPAMKELEVSARFLKVRLEPVSLRLLRDLDAALEAAAKSRPHALLTLPNPWVLARRRRIVEFVARNRLPTMFDAREYVETGGLMAYGPDIAYNFRRAATYVHKILNGTKPQDLPVENPMRFQFVINLKTAKKMALAIPPEVLMRADNVIQ